MRARSDTKYESGATCGARLGNVASNLYSALRQAQAETPLATHGLRIWGRLQSQTLAD